MKPAFWSYADLLTFVGAMLPALGIALLAARGAGALFHFNKPFRLLFMQLVWYVLLAGTLFLIFKLRYGRPFWDSLGFGGLEPGTAAASVFGGPVLAVMLGLFGTLLHTPTIKLPMFDEMLGDLPTKVMLCLFVVALGPLCEEIAFRGFLMPLVARSFGLVSGILSTALLFGALHASEYDYSWRHVVLITAAGAVFGWVRARVNTTASSFLHATFNLTQLAAFFAQGQ